jgi:chaperone BCS1
MKQFENQFMTGGLIIVIFTALLAYVRNVPGKAWWFIKRRFVLTVDIADHDQAFFWVQTWLAAQPYSRRSTLLTVSTRVSPSSDGLDKSETVGKVIDVTFSPAPGLHILRFKSSWILMMRDRTENKGISSQVYRETFTFQTLVRDRKIITDLIEEARLLAFPPEEKAITIQRVIYGGWQPVMKRMPRPLESVVLKENMSQELMKDITQFLGSAGWYRDHGIPYQRGYLLYGPPGNGKTSLIHAVASETGRDIYILRVSAITDDGVHNAISNVPETGIVVVEDVDCLFVGREVTNKNMESMLTFSGFLNALDGISAHEGRLLFMTTNYKEKLDVALIRPGRVDKEFYLGNATKNQAERLFLRFFPERSLEAVNFANNISKEVSMAALQGHLLKYRDDPMQASVWENFIKVA